MPNTTLEINKIKCPYCKHVHDGFYYLELGDMEGNFSMYCEECKKSFAVDFETKAEFKATASAE